MEAAMNSAEASNSFSPLTLLKWLLERIHISRGMLKIRISVVELGRFTLRESPVASRNLVLIILLGKRERNGSKVTGSGSVEPLPSYMAASVETLQATSARPDHVGEKLFRGRGHSACFGLLGDDQLLALVVGGLRDDFSVHEIEFGAVRAAVDDLLRIGVADAGKLLQLILGGAVDVELVGRRRGRHLRGVSRIRWSCLTLRVGYFRSGPSGFAILSNGEPRIADRDNESKQNGQNQNPKLLHNAPSGVDAALPDGVGHAVNGQHVSGDAVVDPVSLGVTNDIFERRLHDGVELLVDHRLFPEVALAVLHPFEIRSGHPPGVGQNVGDDEDALVAQDIIGGGSGRSVGAFRKDAALHPVGVAAGDNVLRGRGYQNFAVFDE